MMTEEAHFEQPWKKYYRYVVVFLSSKANPVADFVLYLAFTFLITIAGHTFQDVYSTRQLVQTFRREFSEYRPGFQTQSGLQQIRRHEHFWDYLGTTVARSIFPDKSFGDFGYNTSNVGASLRFNQIVQHPRVRQIRVRNQTCSGLPPRLNVPGVIDGQRGPGLQGAECHPRYSWWREDESIWQGIAFSPRSLLNLVSRNSLQYKFNTGGYVIELPLNRTLFLERIEALRKARWTDEATRAVFFDIAIFNPTRDVFTSIRILFEFDIYGGVRAALNIRAFRERLAKELATDAMNLGAEAVLYGIGTLTLVREVGKVRALGLATYISRLWNVISMISLGFLIVSFTFRWQISRKWRELEDTDVVNFLPETGSYNLNTDYDWLGESDALIVKFQALTLVLLWLRGFSFLQFFSRKIDDFVATCSHAKGNFIAYVTIMVVIVISFAVGLFIGFGENEKNFNTFPSSMLSLFDLLFGNFNADSLSFEDGILVSTLIIGVFALLTFLSMSAMLAVVNWANREVQNGNVVRETDDMDANLKHRLNALLVRLLSSRWVICFSRAWIENYIKSSSRSEMEQERLSEEEMEMMERREVMVLARSSLRNLIQSVSQLRSQTRSLQAEFKISDVGSEDWAQDNAWRKMRNQYQQLMFQRLLEHLKSGDKDAVARDLTMERARVLRQWKETKGTSGGDVEWRDQEGFAALHFAALSGDPDMVNALLSKQADPDSRNDDGNTPLHLAALTAQLNACRVLAEIGHAKVDERNAASFTPLHMAAYAGNASVVRYLAEELRADVTASNDEGLSPLHLAVMQSHVSAAFHIASNWPSTLELRSNGGETPLHCAVLTHQSVEMVRALLEAGARVSTRMYDSRNAYQAALDQSAAPAVVRLLLQVLKMGDDYSRAQASLGEGAAGLTLIRQAGLGREAEVQALLDAGANIDTVQPNGGTALHEALRRRRLRMVEFLVDAGAEFTIPDHNGRTAMQLAAMEGYVAGYAALAAKTTKELLPVDADGNTLLHLAAMSGRSIAVVEDLVKTFGQDIRTLNRHGVSVEEAAREGLEELVLVHGPEVQRREFEDMFRFFEEVKEDFDDEGFGRTGSEDGFDFGRRSSDAGGRRGSVLGGEEGDRMVDKGLSKRVIKFFERVGMGPRARLYAMLMAENEIDYEGLSMVSDAQLKEMGVEKIGVRNRILQGMVALKTKNAKVYDRRSSVQIAAQDAEDLQTLQAEHGRRPR